MQEGNIKMKENRKLLYQINNRLKTRRKFLLKEVEHKIKEIEQEMKEVEDYCRNGFTDKADVVSNIEDESLISVVASGPEEIKQTKAVLTKKKDRKNAVCELCGVKYDKENI